MRNIYHDELIPDTFTIINRECELIANNLNVRIVYNHVRVM